MVNFEFVRKLLLQSTSIVDLCFRHFGVPGKRCGYQSYNFPQKYLPFPSIDVPVISTKLRRSELAKLLNHQFREGISQYERIGSLNKCHFVEQFETSAGIAAPAKTVR